MTNVPQVIMLGLLEAAEDEPHLPLGMFYDQQGLPFTPPLERSYSPPASTWKPPPKPPVDPDDFDIREWVLKQATMGERKICTSFSETWWPEGSEEYEQENGWENEEGEDLTLDDMDREDGLTNVTKAVKWLKDKGATDTGNDDWYSSEPEQNYRNGHEKEYSYHLKGYTDEELSEIYDAVVNRRRGPQI